jgi:hypothetical protein
MKINARRRASPLLMKARENRNAAITSQTAVLPYPASACAGVRTFPSITTTIPTKTDAPPGIGRKINARIVQTKMASIRQPWTVTVAGRGTKKRITNPTSRMSTADVSGGSAGASIGGVESGLSVTVRLPQRASYIAIPAAASFANTHACESTGRRRGIALDFRTGIFRPG